MSYMPQLHRRFIGLILFAFALAALLFPNFGGAGAQVSLSEPLILPGDTAPAPAAGTQEHQRISKGADTYLAVWTDTRTVLNASALQTGGVGTGAGTLTDIYAARIGADGQVLDATPIIVDQSGHDQKYPAVGWNGQNWLVVWLAEKPAQFSTDYEIRAARVSSAGQLLDATPLVLKPDADSALFPFEVIEDGAGNWVVLWEHFLPPEGTSIPRGAFITKIANDGSIVAPGTRLIYNHHSQFMSGSKLARAGDRYLLTFIANGSPYRLMALTFDLDFNQLRVGPEQLTGNANGYDLATDGTGWFTTWINGASGNIQTVYGTRVSRDGDPLDPTGIVINSNIGVLDASTAVTWDGQFWFVAYDTGYDHATQSYTFTDDIRVSRVTSSGAVARPHRHCRGDGRRESDQARHRARRAERRAGRVAGLDALGRAHGERLARGRGERGHSHWPRRAAPVGSPHGFERQRLSRRLPWRDLRRLAHLGAAPRRQRQPDRHSALARRRRRDQ